MKVIILKYNAGNVLSVQNALLRLGIEAEISDNKQEIKNADKIIFPGVGEANSAMKYLKERGIDELIKNLKKPVLGICLGMQLMCRFSEENKTDCIGVFDINVEKFKPKLKVPHMGWNTIEKLEGELFKDVKEKEYMYFVHTYFIPINTYTTSICKYINSFSASIHKDNFYGTQFHPEKSGSIGEQILKNFIEL